MNRTSWWVSLVLCAAFGCSSDSDSNPDAACGGAGTCQTPATKHSADAGPDASGAGRDPVHVVGVLKPAAKHDAGTTPIDAGADATVATTSDTTDSDAGNEPNQGACGPAAVTFVIDASDSMCTPFDVSTRWRAVRDSLLGSGQGVVYHWEDRAALGVTVFAGTIDSVLGPMQSQAGDPEPDCAAPQQNAHTDGACPQMVTVDAARGNQQALEDAYPQQEPGGSSPTDQALEFVVDRLIAANAGSAPRAHPSAIVLVTDSMPNDICVGGAGGDGSAQREAAVAAVDRAAAAGIHTYVVDMALNNVAVGPFVSDIALHGAPPTENAMLYMPSTQPDLKRMFESIIQNVINCVGL